MTSMNCKQSAQYLQPYVDKELQGSEKSEVEKHIKNCPICRKRFKIEKHFKAVVVKKTQTVKAPKHLRKKITTIIF